MTDPHYVEREAICTEFGFDDGMRTAARLVCDYCCKGQPPPNANGYHRNPDANTAHALCWAWRIWERLDELTKEQA